MRSHALAQTETHVATAVVLEAGTIVKVRYVSDGHTTNTFGPTIPLADRTVILKAVAGDRFADGELIQVSLGIKLDARFGKLQSLLGYRR